MREVSYWCTLSSSQTPERGLHTDPGVFSNSPIKLVLNMKPLYHRCSQVSKKREDLQPSRHDDAECHVVCLEELKN